ncbi:hypothetical protein T439DRAFT_382736 [Meredithblackwellia eburnea MCA 4105]
MSATKEGSNSTIKAPKPILSKLSIDKTTSNSKENNLSSIKSATSTSPSQSPHPRFVASPMSFSRPEHIAFPLSAKTILDESSRGIDSPREAPARQTSSEATADRLFQQLEVIKQLQSGIARKHSELEGVHNSARPGERTDWTWAVKSTTSVAGETKAGTAAEEVAAGLGRPQDDKDRTSKVYEPMSKEFADRQKGVNDIMASLAELSTALKTFHSLPSPVLFPQIHQTSQPSRGSNSSNRHAETAPPEDSRATRLRRVSHEA